MKSESQRNVEMLDLIAASRTPMLISCIGILIPIGLLIGGGIAGVRKLSLLKMEREVRKRENPDRHAYLIDEAQIAHKHFNIAIVIPIAIICIVPLTIMTISYINN